MVYSLETLDKSHNSIALYTAVPSLNNIMLSF